MKVLFLTLGTRGDCQPYVALGMGLVAKGHEVRIVATSEHGKLIEEVSGGTIGFLPLPWTMEGEMHSGDMVAALRSGSTQQALKSTQRQFEEHFKDNVECCEDAIKDWPDVVLANMLLLDIAYALCEKYNKRLIYAFLQQWTASRYEPCFLLKSTPFPLKSLNYLTWTLFASFVLRQRGYLVNPWRKSLGLAPIKGVEFLLSVDRATLYGMSPVITPPPRDYEQWTCHEVTGFWALPPTPNQPAYEPPKELSEFLAAGEAPVYIGWGSMVAESKEKMSEVAFRAILKSGERGILLKGWGNMSLSDLNQKRSDYKEIVAYAEKNVLVLDRAPHQWLFPKCKLCIHHGGAGTTQTSMEAGVPTIVTPFFFDQFMFAAKAVKLGVGPKAPKFYKLTGRKLAKLIKKTVDTPAYFEKAKAVAQLMSKEDGVGTAVKVIEDQFANPHRCTTPWIETNEISDKKRGRKKNATIAPAK